MRYERKKALEAFEKSIEAAKAAARDIRRLEQGEPDNVGFNMLETALPDLRALQDRLHEVRTMWKNAAPREPWQIEEENRANFQKERLDAENARHEAFRESAAAIHRLLRHLEHLEQNSDNDPQEIAPLLRDFLMNVGGHGPSTLDLNRLTNFLTVDQLKDAGTTIAAGGWAVNVVSEWTRYRQREEITATM